MRRWVIIGGVIGAAIVLLCIALAVGRHTADSELARYKAELQAKGEKLTFAEFVPAASTNEDEVASRMAYAKLNLPNVSDKPELMQYIGPGRARIAWRGVLRMNSNTNVGGLGDWSVLAGEVQNDSTNMEAVSAVLNHPAPDSGTVYRDNYNYMAALMFPRVLQFHKASDLIVSEAVLNVHEGRTEAAVSNLVAAAALARFYRNEPWLLADLVRAMDTKYGVWATWELLQATNLTEAELRELQKAWEAVELYDGLERGFEYERVVAILQYGVLRTSSRRDLEIAYGVPRQGTNINAVVALVWSVQRGLMFYGPEKMARDEQSLLAYWTDGLEAVRLLKADRSHADVTNALIAARREEEKDLAGKWGIRKQVLQTAFARDLGATVTSIEEIETLRRMGITAIAIRRYQLKNGTAPKSLDALTPEFLEAVPIDPMSGKALCYRLNSDGTFVLYSVGEDGRDDGGDASPSKAGDAPKMWNGRDAVWPSTATVDEQAKADEEFARETGTTDKHRL